MVASSMATITSKTGDGRRQSYILAFQPVHMSLTDGTIIPAPSPPRTPTPGGPLSSHPPSTASTTAEHDKPSDAPTADAATLAANARSPASTVQTAPLASPAPTRRRAGSVRRMLSLNNLRASFSASRTSLALGPSDAAGVSAAVAAGAKRPSSPGGASTAATLSSLRPGPLRRASSSSWFGRRRSGLFMFSSVEGEGEAERESKRRKESRPPLLPSINELAGGEMTDGRLEWDEGLFKR